MFVTKWFGKKRRKVEIYKRFILNTKCRQRIATLRWNLFKQDYCPSCSKITRFKVILISKTKAKANSSILYMADFRCNKCNNLNLRFPCIVVYNPLIK